MRIYQNIAEMYSETRRELKEMGIQYISETVQDQQVHRPTLELSNYVYTLSNPNYDDAVEFAADNGINEGWLRREMYDRTTISLGQKNPNPAHALNFKFWEQFLRDGCFSYSYPERIHPQMERVIHELQERPNTRQAIITMYDWHQDLMNAGGRDRVPCSMHYQFMIRDSKVICSYVMRSCDFHKFFLADMALAIGLQSFIALRCNMDIGSMTHFMGSLHVFKDEVEDVF